MKELYTDEVSENKRSKRRQETDNFIKKQQKIAKFHNVPEHEYESHRYAKTKAMNCGDPNCVMCMNPRKSFKQKTLKEKSFNQTENLW
jgi:hypothetical protein